MKDEPKMNMNEIWVRAKRTSIKMQAITFGISFTVLMILFDELLIPWMAPGIPQIIKSRINVNYDQFVFFGWLAILVMFQLYAIIRYTRLSYVLKDEEKLRAYVSKLNTRDNARWR